MGAELIPQQSISGINVTAKYGVVHITTVDEQLSGTLSIKRRPQKSQRRSGERQLSGCLAQNR